MSNDCDIAIIGMSCRLPGAHNVEEFWRNLANGVESITRFSDDEITESGIIASYLTNPNYVKAAPVLEDPDTFDAGFFGFSAIEARTMDPQHRILLELAWEALEDAGCDPERYRGRTGVFAGAALNTYFLRMGLDRRLVDDYIPTLIVNDKDFLSTRISYKLNLKGPSITVQTACSTSLVAVHLACQSLLSGETDMALAGAISVKVPHRAGYLSEGGGITSPDGCVRAFDAKANGTVFGSGGGIVVLKRLSDALTSGDTIHAVIKGSAVNNDGSEKAGYTAPSVNSQADAVVEALANAGIEADSISYIETHGSGTPVGDPIEIMALSKAFRTFTSRSSYCAIGSVKTNLGHLDVAAGIAGLIKTILALKHRKIPASLNFTQSNPEIDFPSTPFYVNTQLATWNSNGPRRAGIMSTGMGGTNAHVVIEEAPEIKNASSPELPGLLILSARTSAALDSAAIRLREFLRSAVSDMDDVAFTLQSGRKRFSCRRFLVYSGRSDAIVGLEEISKRTVSANLNDSARRPLIFLLPGVGDHYVGMAHQLYGHFAAFKSAVDRCAQILEPYIGVDIRRVLYPASRSWTQPGAGRGIDLKKMLSGKTSETEDVDSQTLNRTIHAQPALFTIEYALARLWEELGLIPDAIVGHSMGEYTAACLAGVLSLDDALRLIVRRTQMVDQLPPARMLAVALPEDEIRPLLYSELSLSLINGPNLCVVAGPIPSVNDFEGMLGRRGVICRHVQNTHAFHSRMLDPIVKGFEEEVRRVRLNEPRIPCMSNVTGRWLLKGEATDPGYWARHANHTARFSDALRTLWQLPNPRLLEVGPGRTLGVLAMQHPERQNAGNPVVLSSLRHHYENENDVAFFMNSIGGLWLSGLEAHWENLHQRKPCKVSLPTYPFERERYWIEADSSRNISEMPSGSRQTERLGVDDWFYIPSWKRTPFPRGAESTVEIGILWVIFTDRWGGGIDFQSRLREVGAAVQVVRFGEKFHLRSDGSFEIDARSGDDYLRLFREIKGTAAKSINIVHLGCLTEDNSRMAQCPGDDQDFGFFSLLHIAQAVSASSLPIPIRIGVVSNRMHEVTGDEILDPRMATVLGPVGVIPNELSNVTCFNIDLPGPRLSDCPPADVLTKIIFEFVQENETKVIAYRGRYRWERVYESVRLPVRRGSGLRDRGVYLITGGTGGLGLALARHLAKTCQARLVLTKRTAFPDRSRWEQLLASGETAATVLRTIKDLLEIEGLGAEVEVFVAEASDRERMRRVVSETLHRFKVINGVIHAAGIVRPGLIQTKTKETVRSVLSPKVQGTVLLFELLKDVDLDFMVLYSSMSSITMPYAFSDYSAANAFLDAFAGFAGSKARFRTLSINWPIWKEAGLVGELKAMLKPLSEKYGLSIEDLKEEAIRKAILTKDGLESFTRALKSDFTQIIVSPENLDKLIAQSRVGSNSSTALAPSRSGSNTPDSPTTEMETAVAKIWISVLGRAFIGIHEPFSSLGGHSLMAMQIVSKIRLSYQIDLTLKEFFESPTIARLSAAIRDKILREIESLTDSEAQRLASTDEGR